MADITEDSVDVKPPIIMKVDAPPEDNNTITSQEESINNADQSDSVKVTSKNKKSVLSFAMRQNVLSSPKLSLGVVLRPSQLGSKVENNSDNTKNSFALNPSRLNPFAKDDHDIELNNCSREKDLTTCGVSSTTVNETNNGTDTPKFVPLVSTEPATKSTTPITSSVASTSNFIFGQNLHERVISEQDSGSDLDVNSVPSTSCVNTNANSNGTSELLFSNAAKKNVSSETTKEVKSLTESAREYEESRANKRKYEEVTIVTGEEDEKNVLQLNCKLFAFDKATGNWQERGRGTLRLNDKEVEGENAVFFNQSRLVIRTSGSLRVVLNTKIWAEQTIDRASSKSLRLTAMDATGQIRVFLIMASSEEINQLQRLLEIRVKSEVDRQKQTKNVHSEPDSKKPAMDNSLSDQ